MQGTVRNVWSNIMCTYSWSCVSKEVSKIHHMYLPMVTCHRINELLVVPVTDILWGLTMRHSTSYFVWIGVSYLCLSLVHGSWGMSLCFDTLQLAWMPHQRMPHWRTVPCVWGQFVLRHGRDVLPTRDKSTTGNVALRFWFLVEVAMSGFWVSDDE